MVSEVVSVHIGQAGLQLGNALWELLCLEHGIGADGIDTGEEKSSLNCPQSIFNPTRDGRFVPRALLFDLEPTVIDEIRTGRYNQLWNPNYQCNGKEDAASLYARGYHSIGVEYLSLIMDRLRKLSQQCDCLSAFQLIYSFAGGTGSGLGARIFEHLMDEYGKKFRFSLSVFPSARFSQATVEPYNSILHANSGIETCDCNVICDNETLYTKCTQNLTTPSPSITLINRLFAQMATSLFLAHRFLSFNSVPAHVCEVLTNLIPYPRIHFPIMAMAPIATASQLSHENYGIDQLTDAAFLMESQCCTCDIYRNKYMSCCLMYRGDISIAHIYSALANLKTSRHVNFVDWCPTGFKISVNGTPPLTLPWSGFALPSRSLVMIAGNVGIRETWSALARKYDQLMSKRAFVHHYVAEGMEEGEMLSSRETIAVLESDYTEVARDLFPDDAPDEMPKSPPFNGGTDDPPTITVEERKEMKVMIKTGKKENLLKTSLSPVASVLSSKQQKQTNNWMDDLIFEREFCHMNKNEVIHVPTVVRSSAKLFLERPQTDSRGNTLMYVKKREVGYQRVLFT